MQGSGAPGGGLGPRGVGALELAPCPISLHPLAAAGPELRAYLARAMAIECLPGGNDGDDGDAMRLMLRADRLQRVVRERLDNGLRYATVTMALAAFGPTVTAAGARSISLADLAFYAGRRALPRAANGKVIVVSPPDDSAAPPTPPPLQQRDRRRCRDRLKTLYF